MRRHDQNLERIADNVHQLRKNLEISLEELSKITGYSISAINKIELYESTNPCYRLLNSLAGGLGVELSDLLRAAPKTENKETEQRAVFYTRFSIIDRLREKEKKALLKIAHLLLTRK